MANGRKELEECSGLIPKSLLDCPQTARETMPRTGHQDWGSHGMAGKGGAWCAQYFGEPHQVLPLVTKQSRLAGATHYEIVQYYNFATHAPVSAQVSDLCSTCHRTQGKLELGHV